MQASLITIEFICDGSVHGEGLDPLVRSASIHHEPLSVAPLEAAVDVLDADAEFVVQDFRDGALQERLGWFHDRLSSEAHVDADEDPRPELGCGRKVGSRVQTCPVSV